MEQDANIVIMLHTDDIDQKFEKERFIKLFVRKNRDGKLGRISYGYRGDYAEFVEKEFNPLTGNYEEVPQHEEFGITEDDLPF